MIVKSESDKDAVWQEETILYTEIYQGASLKFITVKEIYCFYGRGAQIVGAGSPGQPSFLQWRLIFMGPRCGICMTSPASSLDFYEL